MGSRLVTSDPDQEGCQLQGPSSPPAKNHICQQFLKATGKPRNHPQIITFPVQGACCIVCIKQTNAESNIVPIGIKEGPTSHQYLTACHPEKVVPSVPRDFALKFNT